MLKDNNSQLDICQCVSLSVVYRTRQVSLLASILSPADIWWHFVLVFSFHRKYPPSTISLDAWERSKSWNVTNLKYKHLYVTDLISPSPSGMYPKNTQRLIDGGQDSNTSIQCIWKTYRILYCHIRKLTLLNLLHNSVKWLDTIFPCDCLSDVD